MDRSLKESYDWVVLGDHPGALLGAVLVARLGLTVLVLPRFGRSVKLVISGREDCLDYESNFLLGFGSQGKNLGLLTESLTRAGGFSGDSKEIRSLEGIPQILTSGARFEVGSAHLQFESELEREFGAKLVSEMGLVPALQEVESEYWRYWSDLGDRLSLPAKEKRSQTLRALRDEIDSKSGLPKGPGRFWLNPKNRVSDMPAIVQDTKLAQCLLGIWYGAMGHPAADPHVGELLQSICLMRLGGGYRGGLAAYREFLLRLAKKNGADIGSTFDCQGLVVEKGIFQAVELVPAELKKSKQAKMSQESGENVRTESTRVAVRGGVLGTSLEYAGSKLLIRGASAFKRLKKGPPKVGWRFTVGVRVQIEALPPGVTSRMIWKEGEAPPLEIEITLPSDYGLVENVEEQLPSEPTKTNLKIDRLSDPDESQRIIFLRTVLPFTLESLQPEYQRVMAGRMVKKLIEILPFVEFHMIRIFPDFRKADSSEEFDKVYPFRSLEEVPDNLCCFASGNGEVGVGSSSGIEGLFLASDEAYPELGSLGGVVAALESSAWLAHRSGLPGPFG